VPGAIAYFQLRKRVAGWRAERRGPDAGPDAAVAARA
jgi:hypothetical protein